MKQVLQNLKSGTTVLVDIPAPLCKSGHLLIATSRTLISAGTERMLIDFGKAGYIKKARQQPDKVKQVIDKVKTDGLLPTIDAVRSKLDHPLAMGYCSVGKVQAIGEGQEARGLKVGDRVASNGNHAEIVCVPQNLCAKIPDNVSDEAATFTVPASIGLQGVRLAQPTLGEAFVVTGLGLIGLLTVQLLRAHGCRVLGVDLDSKKCELARQFGAETVDLSRGEDPLSVADAFSRRRGVDGVLITASTKSSEPVHQAAVMCRKRSRIILVGVTGLELSRADFYEKELTFQVSCSYGPGRYDSNYEEKGNDYPLGFVRWTEQRNFEAVLDMIADSRLIVEPLISHCFTLEQAPDAYKVLTEDRSALGILLQYQDEAGAGAEGLKSRSVQLSKTIPHSLSPSVPVVGFIGSGNYATRILIPAFKDTGAILKSVASSGGVSGVHAGRKYGFHETTTDTASLIADEKINTVVITTRHDSHARIASDALRAGKHVFVEKPLALTLDELFEIESTYSSQTTNKSSHPLLMVGFNRRFAPQVQKVKSLLEGVREPKSFIMTVNAGKIPSEHWTLDPKVGGGRIIGEGCHFIDLLRFLAGSNVMSSEIVKMESGTGDTVSIQLGFADGSVGTVHYFANGDKSFPKERLDVFCAGRILQLDNFRKLKGFGWPGFKKMNLLRQDKGQKSCAAAFIEAIKEGKPSPILFEELIEVSRVTIELSESLKK